MKKCFGVLCAAMIVFCLVGTADATRFGHGRCFGQNGFFGGEFTPPFGNGPRIFPILCGLLGGEFTPPFGNGPRNITGPLFGNGPLFNCTGLGGPSSQPSTHSPEPATMLLLGGGLAGICLFRRKFRKQ
jgi:hypothetical protein